MRIKERKKLIDLCDDLVSCLEVVEPGKDLWTEESIKGFELATDEVLRKVASVIYNRPIY